MILKLLLPGRKLFKVIYYFLFPDFRNHLSGPRKLKSAATAQLLSRYRSKTYSQTWILDNGLRFWSHCLVLSLMFAVSEKCLSVLTSKYLNVLWGLTQSFVGEEYFLCFFNKYIFTVRSMSPKSFHTLISSFTIWN